MSILQEIYHWSKDLPDWQQDAIAKLYVNRSLSAGQLDDLYALAKAEVGIPDDEGREATKLQETEIATDPSPTRLVKLGAVRGLVNVNALAEGIRLPIALDGLTVVYGENGTGKSGYSRVFKHACRARDTNEPILPDAKLDPKEVGGAEAIFEANIDGSTTDLVWRADVASPEELSDISIFDTHCARAYIDNHGDYAYVPYGLDILEGLASVCVELKNRAIKEKSDNTPSENAYAALTSDQTAVAKALNNITSNKTKTEDIEALATLSEQEQKRLIELNKTLTEADPKQKAQALRQKARRFENLKSRITNAAKLINDEKLTEIQELLQKYKSAKKAAELAASQFKDTPGQLPGTGSDEWKTLFNAAREYAKISHAEHDFPDFPDNAKCPLCQNQLGNEGVKNLVRFDSFIEQEVEKAALHAHKEAATAYKLIRDANLELHLEDALVDELREANTELAEGCLSMQSEVKLRREKILEAAENNLNWSDVPKFTDESEKKLTENIESLLLQAKDLEATADEKTKAAMVAEQAELDSRNKLFNIKAAVIEAIQKYQYCQMLQKCINNMDTMRISRKSTHLSQTIASQELADTLNKELEQLKVHELKIVMKPESSRGRTTFKLVLEVPGGGAPSSILSEGEQRAIAIASFLAEVKLGKGLGGVVFDDPVSSLDHRRRWEVAERLAKESLSRQVIVFTHDIYFLCILEQKAEEVGSNLCKNYIRRTPQGYGVHSDELPFDVVGTKERIKRLRRKLVDVKSAYEQGDEDAHRRLTSECYGELRLAWERCIEEVLFNQVIERFGEGVSTMRLKRVLVTDDDYAEIDAGMTKSSKFEHDAARSVGRLPTPALDVLYDDIERLEAFRLSIIKRGEQVAAGRA